MLEKQRFQQGETTRLDINCLNQNHPCMDLQTTKRNNKCKYFVLYIICQEITMVTYDDFLNIRQVNIDSIIIRQTLDILPFQKITLICPVLDIIRKWHLGPSFFFVFLFFAYEAYLVWWHTSVLYMQDKLCQYATWFIYSHVTYLCQNVT